MTSTYHEQKSSTIRFSRSKDCRMASVAGIKLAGDMTLLLAPHDLITQVYEFVHYFPAFITDTSYRLLISIEETVATDYEGLVSAHLRSCDSMG